MPELTNTQKSVIRCAYFDLLGALETKDNPSLHDWDAHKTTIYELTKYFYDVIGEDEND